MVIIKKEVNVILWYSSFSISYFMSSFSSGVPSSEILLRTSSFFLVSYRVPLPVPLYSLKLLRFIRHVSAQLLSSCLLLRSPSLLPEPAPLEPGLQVQMEVRRSYADSFMYRSYVYMITWSRCGSGFDYVDGSGSKKAKMGRKNKKNQYGNHVLKSWMFSPEKNFEHFFEKKIRFFNNL